MIAQIPEAFLTALPNYGAMGLIVLYFMFRDSKQQEYQREREMRLDDKIDALVSSMNHLSRALTLEVLTRPQAQDRARKDATDLLERISQ